MMTGKIKPQVLKGCLRQNDTALSCRDDLAVGSTLQSTLC